MNNQEEVKFSYLNLSVHFSHRIAFHFYKLVQKFWRKRQQKVENRLTYTLGHNFSKYVSQMIQNDLKQKISKSNFLTKALFSLVRNLINILK